MKPGIRRLIEELRGLGCNVRGIWPPPVELPNDIDTVFHLVETAEAPAFVASASDDDAVGPAKVR